MKKVISVIISILMLAAIFSACGGGSPVPGENTSVSQTPETSAPDAELIHSVPELNFDGAKIRVVTANEEGNGIDIGVQADETESRINEAVYKRDRAVEDILGVRLTVRAYDTLTGSFTAFSDSVRAQSDDFDFAFASTNLVFPFASEGALDDLAGYGYIDLGMPWWDGTVNGDHLIGGSLYAAVGSISVNDLLRTHMILFNANIFEDNRVEFPYAKVEEGSWTIDYFTKLATDLNSDVDGDGVVSNMAADVYGFASYAWCSPYTLWYGCDGSVIGHSDDGWPVVEIDTGKTTAIYEKMYAAIIGSGSNYIYDGALYGELYNSFTQGRAAMTEACMMHLTHWPSFRDMADDYGIVPAPKFDENQKDYISYAEVIEPAVCVPSLVSSKQEMISAVLEVMAYESYRRITPAVFEVSLKERFSRDEPSKKMLDIIAGSRRSCLGSVFIPSYSFTVALPTIIYQRNEAVSSYIEQFREAMIGALDGAMEKFR
ncbi:MAG: hypothetical protein J5563_06585 [Clostridia bacterium]|nr:hypothetical protein [Clostridia bacterium]